MGICLINGGEDAGGLDNIFSTSFGPFDLCRVFPERVDASSIRNGMLRLQVENLDVVCGLALLLDHQVSVLRMHAPLEAAMS